METVASNKGLPVFSVTIHVVTITYCDGHSPCKTDMHDTSASLQSLEADNFAVPCAPAFKSVVERWPSMKQNGLDSFRAANLGPGAYGIPPHPDRDWNRAGARHTPSPCFPSHNPTSTSRFNPDLLPPSQRPPEIPSGPGMHYSPEHERLTTSVSPERMGLNESRRGSSSFLGPGRPSAARRSIGPDPGHSFNQVAEMKKWLRGGGKSVARASICARVSRWEQFSDLPRYARTSP